MFYKHSYHSTLENAIKIFQSYFIIFKLKREMIDYLTVLFLMRKKIKLSEV